jgi:hypothetical protein
LAADGAHSSLDATALDGIAAGVVAALVATGNDAALTALEGCDQNVAAVVARFGGRDATVARFKVLSRRRRRRNRGRRISIEHETLRAGVALFNAGRRAQPRWVGIEIEGLIKRFTASAAGIDPGSPVCVAAERRLAGDALQLFDRVTLTAEKAGVDCERARAMRALLAQLMAARNYRAVYTHAFQTSGALATLIACKGFAPLPSPVRTIPNRALCAVAKSLTCRNRGREGRSRSHRRIVSRTGKESAAGDGGPGGDGPAGWAKARCKRPPRSAVG